MTRITPKPSASPLAIRAYTPPVSSPRMQAWTKRCIAVSGRRSYPPQAGFGENGFASATFAGNTGSSLPPTHSTSRSSPFGSPYWFQERLPSIVGHVPEWSAVMIFWLSIEPVFLATSWSSWPTAYASAELLSMSNLLPPYFFRYCWTKSAFPLVGAAGSSRCS